MTPSFRMTGLWRIQGTSCHGKAAFPQRGQQTNWHLPRSYTPQSPGVQWHNDNPWQRGCRIVFISAPRDCLRLIFVCFKVPLKNTSCKFRDHTACQVFCMLCFNHLTLNGSFPTDPRLSQILPAILSEAPKTFQLSSNEASLEAPKSTLHNAQQLALSNCGILGVHSPIQRDGHTLVLGEKIVSVILRSTPMGPLEADSLLQNCGILQLFPLAWIRQYKLVHIYHILLKFSALFGTMSNSWHFLAAPIVQKLCIGFGSEEVYLSMIRTYQYIRTSKKMLLCKQKATSSLNFKRETVKLQSQVAKIPWYLLWCFCWALHQEKRTQHCLAI